MLFSDGRVGLDLCGENGAGLIEGAATAHEEGDFGTRVIGVLGDDGLEVIVGFVEEAGAEKHAAALDLLVGFECGAGGEDTLIGFGEFGAEVFFVGCNFFGVIFIAHVPRFEGWGGELDAVEIFDAPGEIVLDVGRVGGGDFLEFDEEVGEGDAEFTLAVSRAEGVDIFEALFLC